ncbi:hypothetical protein Tco_0835199 [Tanacetum coccineum]
MGEVEEAVRMISSTYSSKPLSRNCKAKDSPHGSMFDNVAKCLIAVDAFYMEQTMLTFGGRGTSTQVLLSMRALYLSHIACFQLGSRRAWNGDLRIWEEEVTWKLYLGLAFTVPTLERVTIGCFELFVDLFVDLFVGLFVGLLFVVVFVEEKLGVVSRRSAMGEVSRLSSKNWLCLHDDCKAVLEKDSGVVRGASFCGERYGVNKGSDRANVGDLHPRSTEIGSGTSGCPLLDSSFATTTVVVATGDPPFLNVTGLTIRSKVVCKKSIDSLLECRYRTIQHGHLFLVYRSPSRKRICTSSKNNLEPKASMLSNVLKGSRRIKAQRAYRALRQGAYQGEGFMNMRRIELKKNLIVWDTIFIVMMT